MKVTFSQPIAFEGILPGLRRKTNQSVLTSASPTGVVLMVLNGEMDMRKRDEFSETFLFEILARVS